MKKFEIYQLGNLPSLTVVEADIWYINHDDKALCFIDEKKNEILACFNFNNIVGFKELNK